MKREEIILCAAIWFNDGKQYEHQPVNIETGFVICGMRHHNCFNPLANCGRKHTDFNTYYGFLTSRNEYVNRMTAADIALKAGQITHRKQELYSDDLY